MIATASNTVVATVAVGSVPAAFGRFIGPAPVVPGSTRICSALGDDRPPSQLDQDVFRFSGAKGESVKLKLAETMGAQNRGKQAILLLIDDIRGVTFARFDAGDLPNEISAKLPAAGRYLVVVAEEPKFARGVRFTGNYCVTLESSVDAWRSFEATGSVELVMPQ